MRSGRHRWAVSLALLAMLPGCASYEGTPNPAWFPAIATAADDRVPGSVALMVPPQVQTSVSPVGKLLKLQTGAIAEQAMRAALGNGMEGGVRQVYGAPPTGGRDATLVIDAVRFQHLERTVWYLWVPPLSQVVQYEASTTLAFDVSLFDAQGGLVWTRSYDDDAGRWVWTTPSADSTPLPEDIGRVVHESAWRLAQRVSRELREWILIERMRPRSL